MIEIAIAILVIGCIIYIFKSDFIRRDVCVTVIESLPLSIFKKWVKEDSKTKTNNLIKEELKVEESNVKENRTENTCDISKEVLDEVAITTNKNTIPYDTEKPFVTSGVRVGTAAITSRGFKEEDAIEVGKIIALVLKNPEDAAVKEEARKRVDVLTAKYPLYA